MNGRRKEITPEYVADLERRIAERAQVYMTRPETRPHGFQIGAHWKDPSSLFSPFAELEACLERAAKDLAPDFDPMMMRYLDRPPEMKLGLYRGPG